MLKSSIIGAALLLALAGTARAEVIDISTVKCADLAEMSTDEGSYLMIWLHGYYGGKADDTTIDLDSFEAAGKAIGDKCAENPGLGLMTVVNQLEAEQ